MDVQDMISEMNDHGFTDTGTPRKVSMLNDALQDLSSRAAWPCHLSTVDLAFDGVSDIPTNLPADWRAAHTLTHVMDGSSKTLSWARLDDLDKAGTDYTATGPPTRYYFVGSALRVWPIPPAGTVVRARYWRIPATLSESTLSAAVDWPVQHHRALVLGALYRLYDLEDDPELAVRFQAHFEQRIAQAMDNVFTQQTDRPDHIRMDPWFDYDTFD